MAIGTRRLTPLVAAAAVSLALGACGGDDGIDTGEMEEEITSGLVEQTGTEPTSVDCPGGIEAEEGTEVECTATAPDGTEAIVEVTLTDDEGGFDWNVPPEQFE